MSLRVEERVKALEARMTDLERLPARMDRLTAEVGELRTEVGELRTEVSELRTEIRTEFTTVHREITAADERVMTILTARIEDSRREMRVLHEDAIARIAVIGEGLAANSQTLASFASETKAMFETVSGRLTGIESRLPVSRHRKRTDQ